MTTETVIKDEHRTQEDQYIRTIRTAPPFGWRDKIGYMLGDLGGNSLQTLVNVYMLMYLVNVVGLKAVHFAVVIAVCRLLDAVNDPIIGRFVDRLRGRRDGKYKPWLRWIPIPMALLTIALFADISSWPYAGKLLYALVIYFVWGVVSSFWNIPYGTMLNSLSTPGADRTQLPTFRSIGSTGANVLVTTIAPLLIFNHVNEPQSSGFLILSIGLAVFSVLCLWGTHRLTHERVVISHDAAPQKIQYLKVLASFAKNRPMIAIIASYIIFKFTIQTIPILNQYVFMSYFKNTAILSAIGLGTLVPLVLGMLVLKPMVARFGKRNLATWPLVIAAGLYAMLAVTPVSPVMWIGIEMVCSFCYGFFMLMLWAMIADAVDYQAVLTRQRNDGIVYSTVTFVVFLVASLSTSFIAIILDVLGYQPELQADQTAQVALNLRIAAGALPAIGCVLVFLIFRYVNNISDARMEEIREEASLIGENGADDAPADDDAPVPAPDAPADDGAPHDPARTATHRPEGDQE